ncbi:M20/M25/M40 family metallo-hydrolase [Neobacillus sp. SAB-20_R2A]|uniref:M20/M25/M40 family metallo-hydrolase n=1 Tax=Neobacillus sp. SAB-20_R2A TaxID=3120519 RepID=UPI003C6DE51A
MEKVYQFIEDHKDMYLDWLIELCKQPSVAVQNRVIRETINLVKNHLDDLNAKVEIIETPGNPIIFGELNSSKKKTLSFYNHYDVQPEDPVELWESPPFSPEIREGKLFARGVADNKGTLLSRICAVHAYQKVYGELPVNIKFIIEGEEEVGSPNLEWFADNHVEMIASDGCIWENGFKSIDGTLQISLGCKGMLYVELCAQGANTDLHSAKAAIIENPAWRLVWALSTLKNEKEEILIDGFYNRILPLTDEERALTEGIEYLEKEELEQLGVKHYVNHLTGFALKEKLIYQPTCTICGIESGYTDEGAKTVLPSKAKVKLDFRLVSEQDPGEILTLLRKHLDKHGFQDIEIIPLKGQRAAVTNITDPLVDKVIKSATKFYNKEPQVLRSQAGTGPMYKLCQKFGIPSVGFGVGNSNSKNHAPNENIFISDFLEGIKLSALVLHEFAD